MTEEFLKNNNINSVSILSEKGFKSRFIIKDFEDVEYIRC